MYTGVTYHWLDLGQSISVSSYLHAGILKFSSSLERDLVLIWPRDAKTLIFAFIRQVHRLDAHSHYLHGNTSKNSSGPKHQCLC